MSYAYVLALLLMPSSAIEEVPVDSVYRWVSRPSLCKWSLHQIEGAELTDCIFYCNTNVPQCEALYIDAQTGQCVLLTYKPSDNVCSITPEDVWERI